jgi:hypothetical protein
MSDNDCSTMELWCLERAKTDAKNRGKWLAQAERWHELTRARNSWRFQKKAFSAVNARRANGNAALSVGMNNGLSQHTRLAALFLFPG